MIKKLTPVAAGILLLALFVGWGANAHKKINRNIYFSYNNSMTYFLSWTDSLAKHAADPDNRKYADTTESRRHYMDLDRYAEFFQNGRIHQNIDSMYAIYGWANVVDNGIVPFAILAWEDSLRVAFVQRNFQRAMILTADLGHYVGDMHQPLHITQFYDGRSTGSSGIHSRYETTMFNKDSSFIQYTGDSLYYINNLNQEVFKWMYANYKYVDSVLIADSLAYLATGSHSSSAYYDMLWNQTKNFTIDLFKKASNRTALVLYKAWVDAGSPLPSTGVQETGGKIAGDFNLKQNYLNPFNPSTKIEFNISKQGYYSLKVYDIQGRLVRTMFESYYMPGEYKVTFDGTGMSSGVYVYALKSEFNLISKFMIFNK